MKVSTQEIIGLKDKRPVVAITAYDAVMAHYADMAGVDLILVGDSVGTTQLGFKNTIPVTLDMIVHHTAAVVRAKTNALVIADIPFALAHDEFSVLLNACRRLMQEAGAEAIKFEGGAEVAPLAERLIHAGIPVVGHIGLLPQQFYTLGGYRKFGGDESEQEKILNDALALEAVGCFSIIIEMVEAKLAGRISDALKIPLIGIGSGPHCDGQILVLNDMLGLNASGHVPSFVRQFADLGKQVRGALSDYVEEVRKKKFPS